MQLFACAPLLFALQIDAGAASTIGRCRATQEETEHDTAAAVNGKRILVSLAGVL
ncbi:MAG: hypothetical protein WD014_07235 [Dongiaceae bacterium]